MNELQDLIEVSRYYGANKEYTLAGGGNTSYKNEKYIWIKASGAELATITEEGFVQLYRDKVRIVSEKRYSDDERLREVEVKEDLIAANVQPGTAKRPSVETSFHELIGYAFVVHMHPTMINALMCSNHVKAETQRLFGEEALYIPFAPGYSLFLKVKEALITYRQAYGCDPHLIFLDNHGIFVSADSVDEIRGLYAHALSTIRSEISQPMEFSNLEIPEYLTRVLPAIRMKLSDERPVILRTRHTALHREFYGSSADFQRIARPFTPDMILYCKSAYLYLEDTGSEEDLLAEFNRKLDAFRKKHEGMPKIIVARGIGIIAVDETFRGAEVALDVYEDLMKISFYSGTFGGPDFMTDDQIAFIEHWEVETYRRKLAQSNGSKQPAHQKIVVVTGAAQGFGAGIAEDLVENGANVVVADLNAELGREVAERLQTKCRKNWVVFRKTDVADHESVQKLVSDTVHEFGGLDILISNAGILHAGGLDEMKPEVFKRMTDVNYAAWYNCARSASEIMKIQSEQRKPYYFDLIQINSKSGLRGSNRNFAYAGAKFGGIGLTQSFALELAPFNIKVNSICPGNFFDGPLWSDPENGLFIQYLKSGKVPGAQHVDDVKRYYEANVPMGRGCRVDDVMKAIYYVIDQQYETGQAIPVTGGQVMLS
jgi:NAD(P)-dependent dehydrogenase (short-subunit alcohol dehydrogenase family)/rhamnose utilization protein RhaD (predicted bifunctional aldolase and dehydrogenase)